MKVAGIITYIGTIHFARWFYLNSQNDSKFCRKVNENLFLICFLVLDTLFCHLTNKLYEWKQSVFLDIKKKRTLLKVCLNFYVGILLCLRQLTVNQESKDGPERKLKNCQKFGLWTFVSTALYFDLATLNVAWSI